MTMISRWWRLALFLLAVSNISYSLASEMTVQELVRDKQFRVKAWVGASANNPSENFIVNQQVTLFIEIGTSTWFSAGTRLAYLDLANAIVKQRSSTATNYSEQVSGETWSMQLWEIQIYPQQEGKYTIPALDIYVSIAQSSRQSVAGEISIQPLHFNASLPSPKPQYAWFSGKNLVVEQEWQLSSESPKVGDSVTRSISISANDTLSILMPKFEQTSEKAGYVSYLNPAKRSDKYDRGDFTSNLNQSQSNILQVGGEVVFPDFSFQFWDTERQELRTVLIEGKRYDVSHTFKSFARAHRAPLLVVAIIITLLFLISYFGRRYKVKSATPNRWLFEKSLLGKDFKKARLLIYQRNKQSMKHETLTSSKTVLSSEESKEFQTKDTSSRVYRKLWRSLARPLLPKLRLPKALPQLEQRTKGRVEQQK